VKDAQPYIDERGRTWLPFAFKFRNETDGMTFGFEIYAIDRAHAEDQLSWLKQNAELLGEIVAKETW